MASATSIDPLEYQETPIPDEGGGGGSAQDSGDGVSEIPGPEGSHGVEGEGDPETGNGDSAEEAPSPRGVPDSENGGNPGKSRRRKPRTARGDFITDTQIAQALRLSGGDRNIAASALNTDIQRLHQRIARNRSLRAEFGTEDLEVTDKETLSRNADDIAPPEDGYSQSDVELATMVSDADKQLMHQKLLDYSGSNEGIVKRLRMLDGISSGTGKFISLSTELTHRNYFFVALQLSDVSEKLHKEIMEGKYDKDAHEKFFMIKVLAEMAKEQGRAYQLHMQGAEAMVNMIVKTKGEVTEGPKAKPGFGVLGKGKEKKVN